MVSKGFGFPNQHHPGPTRQLRRISGEVTVIPQHIFRDICAKIAQCYAVRTSLFETRVTCEKHPRTLHSGLVWEFLTLFPCMNPLRWGSEPRLAAVGSRYWDRQRDNGIRRYTMEIRPSHHLFEGPIPIQLRCRINILIQTGL